MTVETCKTQQSPEEEHIVEERRRVKGQGVTVETYTTFSWKTALFGKTLAGGRKRKGVCVCVEEPGAL